MNARLREADPPPVSLIADSAPSRLWRPDFPFSPARLPFFYGWVALAAATIGIVFSIPGQTMGFSVFTDVLMAELGLSRDGLSTAYFLGTALSGFTLPSLGRAFDRFGARKMVVGSALATGGFLFYLAATPDISRAFSEALPAATPSAISFVVITTGFYLIRLAAQGVLTMTSRNMIGKWFDYHRGIALSISGAVTAFTFSFAPKGLQWMTDAFGYAGTWRLLGTITIVGMAGLGWLLFRDNPEECGLRMDGREPGSAPAKAHPDAQTRRDFSRPEALLTWSFWNFNLSFAFNSFFATAVTFHILSIAQEAGRDEREVLGYFIPSAIVSVGVNLFCGWASPRMRLKWLLLLMNLAGLIWVAGSVWLQRPWGPAAFIAGSGITGGCFAALLGIVWPRFFGRRWLGAISGVGASSMVLASAVGPIAFARSLSVTGSYDFALWVSASVPAFLAIGSLWADNPQRKEPEPSPLE